MNGKKISILCLVFFLPLFALFASQGQDPVVRLQDSFDATPAVRRAIYTEIIGMGQGAWASDSSVLLAQAVAFKQRAMDAEDDFIESLISSAPGFSNIPRSNPPFLADYQRANELFKLLAAKFPWIKSYAESAGLIVEYWNDGATLFRASLSFKETYPLSRFGKRLLLLAGCRLLLERNYPTAQAAFDALWHEAPTGNQAVLAYRVVEAMRDSDHLKLSPDQLFAWGQAQGLAGNQVFVKLIDRYPGSKEAESAYLEIFRNVNDGFAGRLLSTNFFLADRLENHFSSFLSSFPASSYLPEACTLRAEFNYRCGKKSQAIARKNEYSWNKTKNRARGQTSRIYNSHSDKYFRRVFLTDSLAQARFPKTESRYRIGLLAALSLLEEDYFDGALAKLSSLYEEWPDSAIATRIIWYSGLIHYMRGDYKKVIGVLSPLEKSDYRDSYYWNRAMLFLGKSYIAEGDSQAAKKTLGLLSATYPYTYHGIRARFLSAGLNSSALPDTNLTTRVVSLPGFPGNFTPKGEKINQEARSWQSLGFFAEAAYIYANGLAVVPQDLLLRFRYHENFLLSGWYHRVLRGFGGDFSDFLWRGGVNLPENFWKVVYLNPELYENIIAKQGAKYGIPPALITAIIRQESNFHPRASSHAGAVGLMQVLPSIGRRLSRSLGLGKLTRQQLFNPEVNIKLGVKFLATNLAKYNGNIALAISCYNADSRNLPSWIERSRPENRNGEFDLDLFIELIPLEETHDYNIRVLTNFWRYQEVYGEKKNLFDWQLSSYVKK